MNYAKIRKSDMLVVTLASAAEEPDTNVFIEVETDFVFNLPVYDYRFNQNDSTFYSVGPKAEVISPTLQTFKTTAFPDSDGRSARLQGTHSELCPAGEDTEIDFVIPAGGRWIDGCEYEADGRVVGDQVDFEIVHPNGTTIVEPYALGWWVFPERQYKLYPSFLPEGFIIRVIYHSTGGSAVQFNLNSFLHINDE